MGTQQSRVTAAASPNAIFSFIFYLSIRRKVIIILSVAFISINGHCIAVQFMFPDTAIIARMTLSHHHSNGSGGGQQRPSHNNTADLCDNTADLCDNTADLCDQEKQSACEDVQLAPPHTSSRSWASIQADWPPNTSDDKSDQDHYNDDINVIKITDQQTSL